MVMNLKSWLRVSRLIALSRGNRGKDRKFPNWEIIRLGQDRQLTTNAPAFILLPPAQPRDITFSDEGHFS